MKRLLSLLFLAAVLLAAVACGDTVTEVSQTAPSSSQEETQSAEPSQTEPVIDSEALFDIEEIESPFDIHTKNQKLYVAEEYDLISMYADGWHERSKPEQLMIRWTFAADQLPDGFAAPESFEVLLDTDADFTSPRKYSVQADAENGLEVGVDNLFLDTEYYFKIAAVIGDNRLESEVKSFKTAAIAPRNLNIDGVSNVRDLGGWVIDDHHRIKQGMIYRGAAFEDSLYDTHITGAGIKQAKNELGIKTEIELRWVDAGEIKSRKSGLLGVGVNYYEYQFNYNDEMLLEGNAESIANCFRLFADETKYPIYYHCRIGTDRTGVLTYVLFGFLGLEKDDILKDYLFSNFGYVGGNRQVKSIQKAYIDILEAYEGETLQEKCSYFLKEKCGLDDETLDNIKRLMIEEF